MQSISLIGVVCLIANRTNHGRRESAAAAAAAARVGAISAAAFVATAQPEATAGQSTNGGGQCNGGGGCSGGQCAFIVAGLGVRRWRDWNGRHDWVSGCDLNVRLALNCMYNSVIVGIRGMRCVSEMRSQRHVAYEPTRCSNHTNV